MFKFRSLSKKRRVKDKNSNKNRVMSQGKITTFSSQDGVRQMNDLALQILRQ